jgi:hypothetical protein
MSPEEQNEKPSEASANQSGQGSAPRPYRQARRPRPRGRRRFGPRRRPPGAGGEPGVAGPGVSVEPLTEDVAAREVGVESPAEMISGGPPEYRESEPERENRGMEPEGGPVHPLDLVESAHEPVPVQDSRPQEPERVHHHHQQQHQQQQHPPHHRQASTIGKAIEEVNEVIVSLSEALEEMNQVLELLEQAEREKIGDEREIEALRRAVRQLQRPREAFRPPPQQQRPPPQR